MRKRCQPMMLLCEARHTSWQPLLLSRERSGKATPPRCDANRVTGCGVATRRTKAETTLLRPIGSVCFTGWLAAADAEPIGELGRGHSAFAAASARPGRGATVLWYKLVCIEKHMLFV